MTTEQLVDAPVSAVIFDLDGTLVQTRHASWEVFRKINDRFELGVATPEAFYAMFRGNFFNALEEVCDDPKLTVIVREEFQRLLRSEYLPPMVPGMPDVVRTLSNHVNLCVLSSNVMEVVRRIFVTNGLEYCFAHVFTADVETSKSRAIERFLSDPGYGYRRHGVPAYEEHASARHPHKSETVMVTDTIGDVREANEAGIRSVGVAWGMHSQEELLRAGAEFVAVWPQEVVAHVLPRISDDARTHPMRNGVGNSNGAEGHPPSDDRSGAPSPSATSTDDTETHRQNGKRAMHVTAAVLHAPNEPLVVEEIEIEGPRADEVLVRIVGSGICHTDLGYAAGVVSAPTPLVLGHEGAGVVEAAGSNVTTLTPGDHVVLTFDYCGTCRNCRRGRMVHCKDFLALNMAPDRLDGSSCLSNGHGHIHAHFFGQSSFASYAVASERNAIKVSKDVPLELLGPLGCGIQTGAGAVLNTLRPEAGSSIAIFAVGSVGVSALLGAMVSGCSTIIAVDLNPRRLDFARGLGATHTLDAGSEDVAGQIAEITGGGADYSVDAIGVPAAVRPALECLTSPGVCASIGFQGIPNEMTVDQGHLLFGRSLVGVIEGDSVPQKFIPHMIELYQEGRFPFDRLITKYPFERINEAAAAAHHGEVLKPVLTFAK